MRHAMSNGQERLASHTKDTIITRRPNCKGISVSSPRRAGWLRYFRCPTQEPSIASFFLGQMGQIPTLRYVLCMYLHCQHILGTMCRPTYPVVYCQHDLFAPLPSIGQKERAGAGCALVLNASCRVLA